MPHRPPESEMGLAPSLRVTAWHPPRCSPRSRRRSKPCASRWRQVAVRAGHHSGGRARPTAPSLKAQVGTRSIRGRRSQHRARQKKARGEMRTDHPAVRPPGHAHLSLVVSQRDPSLPSPCRLLARGQDRRGPVYTHEPWRAVAPLAPVPESRIKRASAPHGAAGARPSARTAERPVGPSERPRVERQRQPWQRRARPLPVRSRPSRTDGRGTSGERRKKVLCQLW